MASTQTKRNNCTRQIETQTAKMLASFARAIESRNPGVIAIEQRAVEGLIDTLWLNLADSLCRQDEHTDWLKGLAHYACGESNRLVALMARKNVH